MPEYIKVVYFYHANLKLINLKRLLYKLALPQTSNYLYIFMQIFDNSNNKLYRYIWIGTKPREKMKSAQRKIQTYLSDLTLHTLS